MRSILHEGRRQSYAPTGWRSCTGSCREAAIDVVRPRADRQGGQDRGKGLIMDFISILSIFVLACCVGYYVVWSVTPALHTPLMAVTNAISSVIVVGALIAGAAERLVDRQVAGAGAVVLASVNIFGGFAVTERMLAMYKKKDGRRRNSHSPARAGSAGAERAGVRDEGGGIRCSSDEPLGGAGLSGRGRVLHSRAARAVEPGEQPARQPTRHGGHGARGRHDAGHAFVREPARDPRRDGDRRRRSASSPRAGSR